MSNRRAHVVAFDDSPLGYAQRVNSVAHNNILNSLKSSVLRTIERSRETIDQLNQFNKALVAENHLLSTKLESYKVLDVTESQTAVVSAYDDPIYQSHVVHDKLTGQVTAGYDEELSKVVRYTDVNGDRKSSRDTYISFGPTGSLNTLPSSHPIYNILDGSRKTFWVEDVTPGTEYELRVQFPVSLRPHINSLTLIPFPAFSFKLVAVEITAANGQIIDAIPPTDLSDEISAMRAHIKPISWGNVITIRMKANAEVLGISNLDVHLVDYFDSDAEVAFEVPSFRTHSSAMNNIAKVRMGYYMPGVEATYQPLKHVEVQVGAASSYDDVGTWTDIGYQTLVPENSDKSAAPTLFSKSSGSNFYFKVKFKQRLGQTPVFRYAVITYGI